MKNYMESNQMKGKKMISKIMLITNVLIATGVWLTLILNEIARN